MIFVTVGTELPFDRLIRTVDDWARQAGRTDVFAQIGHAKFEPSFIPFARFLEAPEFSERFRAADCIVSHAGMGTILTALSCGKPLLVMPRRADQGEHRNDHQLATARHMREHQRVAVADDEHELRQQLDQLERLSALPPIAPVASESLIATLAAFIANPDSVPPRVAVPPAAPPLVLPERQPSTRSSR
jgi:UDP-N-acetylglucosamine transferase subunit ALG13